jgi:hypothetical protein
VSVPVAVIALVIAVSMAIAVVVMVVSAAIAVVFIAVSAALIVMVFVLAVVMAIVVADLAAIFAAVEISVPPAMAAPVWALATDGESTVVSEPRVIGAIDISAEADRAMEPGSRSKEDAAGKPSGTVVAERGATIRCVVVVAIRTRRLNADVDGDLYFGPERCSGKAEKREKGEREKPQ